jgi:hypothetical protein
MMKMIGKLTTFLNLISIQKRREGVTRHKGKLLQSGEFHAGFGPIVWFKIHRNSSSLTMRCEGKMIAEFYGPKSLAELMALASEKFYGGEAIKWVKLAGEEYQEIGKEKS